MTRPLRLVRCVASLEVVAMIWLIGAIAACAPQAPRTVGAPAGAVDLAWYETAHDGTLYHVDPARSRLEVRTGRSGPLMHLGHNHVITSTTLSGLVFVGQDRAASRADVWVDVASFVVDEPAARLAAGRGFESVPTAADIAGTSRNMSGPALLDVAAFPRIAARIRPLDVMAARASVTATVNLRGVAQELQLPVEWKVAGDQLEVASTFQAAQTSLGLEPFSAVGGALRVADQLDIRVTLVANARQ